MYNPTDPAFIKNPYPFYENLRENQPVYYSELGFWVVSCFNDIQSILRSKSFGKKYGDILVPKFGPGIFDEPIIKLANNMILLQNPPEHRHVRELIVNAFSPKKMNSLRPLIIESVNELIENFIDLKQVDLIKDFAHPLPLMIICQLIGLEKNEFEKFRKNIPLLCALGRMFDPASLTRIDLDMLNNHAILLYDYFNDFCETHSASEKLVSVFLDAESKGKINRDSLIANLILLFLAGYETTAKFIGNAIYTLFNNQEQLDILRENRKLLPNAVREIMRYESPIQISGRVAFEDVKINNSIIPKDDFVMLIVGSANRDSTIFNNPDQFDINRIDTNSLSFGGGVHQCPGEFLTFLEAEIALDILLARLPNLQIKDLNNPAWQEKSALRGLDFLMATW